MEDREFTRSRILAIGLAKKTGRRIAADYPEIARDYRSGLTQEEIVEKYQLSQRYGLTSNVAVSAVSNALKDLIPEEELDVLSSAHSRIGSIHRANLTYERGTGIFSQTTEDMRRNGRKAGKKCYREGLGVFSLSEQELSDAGKKGAQTLLDEGKGIHAQTKAEKRKASRLGLLAQGKKPLSDEEKEAFFQLCEDVNYQHHSGRHYRRPDYQKISTELKRTFGTKRSIYTLRHLHYRDSKT